MPKATATALKKSSLVKNKAALVNHQIVSISVELGVTTPDNLRHIAFDLEKDTGDDGTVSWTIDFKFQERSSTAVNFVDVVTLTVKVKTKNNDAAEATAKEGLNDTQQVHLQGPAVAASQGVKDGTVTKEQAGRIIERTLPLHDA
jgi:hypothetical protein